MQKKITIYTVKSKTDSEIKRSFTTKRLAEGAQQTLLAFGVESEVEKETKLLNL